MHYLPATRLPWAEDGRCATADPDLFDEPLPQDRPRPVNGADRGRTFRASQGRRDQARQVCRECPVFDLCATHAFTKPEPHGIWAGLTTRARRRIMKIHPTVGAQVAAARAEVHTPTTSERTVAGRRTAASIAALGSDQGRPPVTPEGDDAVTARTAGVAAR